MRQQIDEWPKAKFIIVTRNREDVYLQADFAKSVASTMARLCDVSFMEITTFIQKKFEMSASASEVVATRLHETFHKYTLPAHPSYFADIPSATLNALLQANRRAELIEIAVTGYLSFVVADDKEPIALSRKTREKFLAELVFSMKADGQSYTEAEQLHLLMRLRGNSTSVSHQRDSWPPLSTNAFSMSTRATSGLPCRSWKHICWRGDLLKIP